MLKQFLLLLLLLTSQISSLSAQNTLYFPPKVGTTWQTLTPASQGFCPERVDSLYNFLQVNDTKSFILLKDGKIVLEKYFGSFTQDSFWYWASAGKSLTAFMVGQAQEEGLLNIQSKTSTYLGNGWTSCPPAKEDLITVLNQLTMTTGLDDGLVATPSIPDPDNCTTPECLVYKADAGTRWAYHNAPYRLLHDVITAASGGQTINQFTNSHVLTRTGMKGFWIDHVMYSRPRDMARYGLLVQANGIWAGDTLLHDQQYLYNMVHPSQGLNKSYGYLWWLNGQPSFMVPGVQFVFNFKLIPNAPDDLYAALGKNDQKIHIVPSKGWVIIRMGNPAGGPQGNDVPIVFDNEMWGYLNQLVCNPTATTEQNLPEINIYPNPATDLIQINSDQNIDRIELFDPTGRLLVQQQGKGQTQLAIAAASLPRGVVLLRIFSGGQIVWKQILMNEEG